MTPEEKKQELINIYGDKAINVVEEILDSYHAIYDDYICNTNAFDDYNCMTKYWEAVKDYLIHH